MKLRCALLVCLALAAVGLARAEKVVWRPVTAAVLKLDERPVPAKRNWDVYVADKKGARILVQLGGRFLLLDTGAREMLELDPRTLERKGRELRWENKEQATAETQRPQRKNREPSTPGQKPATPARAAPRLLPSADWVIRDAGRARIVRVRLPAEARVLEVQLPLQPDLRLLY